MIQKVYILTTLSGELADYSTREIVQEIMEAGSVFATLEAAKQSAENELHDLIIEERPPEEIVSEEVTNSLPSLMWREDPIGSWRALAEDQVFAAHIRLLPVIG